MFCKYCGTKISDGDLFCPNCGTKVESSVEVTAKNQKKNKKNIIVVIVAILAILALLAFIFRDSIDDLFDSMTSHNSDKDYDYDDDDDDDAIGIGRKISKGVSPIIKAPAYFGAAPLVSYDEFDGFDSYVISLQQCVNYAAYIESCGYTEDIEMENKIKESGASFDYSKYYVGKDTTQFVSITYSVGICSVLYGAGCQFENSSVTPSSPSNPASPISPVNPGKTKCPLCNGRGKVTCSSCHGTGKQYTTEYAPDYGGGGGGPYQVEHTCKNCGGSRETTCRGCFGEGYIS